MFSSVSGSIPPFVSAVAPKLSDTTPVDPIKTRLNDIIGAKIPFILCGFSGLEYKDNEAKADWIRRVLDQAIAQHGVHNIMVGLGATTQGIGGGYDIIAKEYPGLETMGIVSDKAKGADYISTSCPKENIIYVSAPADNPNSWEVKDEAGKSYMVYAATRNNGVMCFYGGGGVALSEFKEAQQEGIHILWTPQVDPDPVKLEEGQKKRPNEDLTALRTYYEQNHHRGFGDNVTFIH